MRQTKYVLGLPLAIAMGVMLATSASVGSVLAASNMTAGNATKAGNMMAGNATKAGNMTAGNATKAASNATSGNSSNPLAKIGQALSGLFGGKK